MKYPPPFHLRCLRPSAAHILFRPTPALPLCSCAPFLMSVFNARLGKFACSRHLLQAAKAGFHKNTGADFAGAGLDLMAEFSRHMKRWAALTVLLYALALLVLTVPVALVAFGNWGLKNDSMGIKAALAMYANWGYWLWLGILVAGQALLLLLPINIAERRLPARRPLKVPVIVTAFFLANLFFAGVFSILCAIFTDKAFDYFDLFALLHSGANLNDANNNSGSGTLFTMILTVVLFWIIWALI